MLKSSPVSVQSSEIFAVAIRQRQLTVRRTSNVAVIRSTQAGNDKLAACCYALLSPGFAHAYNGVPQT
jgi:hypothetical protein